MHHRLPARNLGKLAEGGQITAQAKPQKAARGRSMKARPTQSRGGVKGGLRPFSSAPCRVKGQRPLWGLGQRPNCSAGDQYAKRAQQRCRQRSVPASNFARPQTRPQAALPPRFREDNLKKAGDLPAFFSALPSIHCRSAEPASCAAGRFSAPRRYPAANCIP